MDPRDGVTPVTYALKRVMTTNRQQFELFKNEIDLLNRLKGKPNIIQMVDSEVPAYHGGGHKQQQQQLKVVMEHGDLDLNKYLQQEPDLSLG